MFTPHVSEGIDYRDRPGTGPVLVLSHGIGSNADSFAALMPRLPADWRVVAWNMPGYGGSEPLAADWPLAADYAAQLADAEAKGILVRAERELLERVRAATFEFISVDDFDPAELAAGKRGKAAALRPAA